MKYLIKSLCITAILNIFFTYLRESRKEKKKAQRERILFVYSFHKSLQDLGMWLAKASAKNFIRVSTYMTGA